MKRTFISLAAFTFLTWTGSNLWLAGFQQGYEQGQSSAWDRATRSFELLSQRQQPALGPIQLRDMSED